MIPFGGGAAPRRETKAEAPEVTNARKPLEGQLVGVLGRARRGVGWVSKGPAAVIARLRPWAPIAAKAIVAAWMLAVLYELHEIQRQAEYTSSSTSTAAYHLDRLQRRLAPVH